MCKIKVLDKSKGVEIVKKKIYKFVDQNTVLFLSGGSTPKFLYQTLAKEEKLKVGAVAMVDERYGPSMHEKSNEKMIRDAGLISYFERQKISFYPILKKGKSRRELAKDYDRLIENLLSSFKKSVVILGIGLDGHTAGIPAGSQKLSPQMRDPAEARKFKNQKLATSFEDFPGESKERISLTLGALSKMDLLIVLAFGEEKKKALELMFSKGSIEEIPARFFKTPEISQKTLLITDQKL